MSDLIRDALERLVNTSEVRDWELNDREWHDAMCYARKVLADTPRAATLLGQPVPPPAVAWPELPDCPEEWRTGDRADTEYVGGLRVGYRNARNKLAAMNPNHQENRQ